MREPTIYSASKIWHGVKWIHLRDHCGYLIISSWINLENGTPENRGAAVPLTFEQKQECWDWCANEPANADMTVVYAEDGDEMRGALVEIGAALSHFKPVYLIGDCATFRVASHSDVGFCSHRFFHKINTQNHIVGYRLAVQHWKTNYGARILKAA